MRKSLLIYAIPAALVFASPFLPDSGKDSRDVAFIRNLGPNVLPIAFWLTVIIFIARLAISFARRRDGFARGFDVVATHAAIPVAEEPNAAMDRPRVEHSN